MYEDILISYVQVTVWHSQVYFYSHDYVDQFVYGIVPLFKLYCNLGICSTIGVYMSDVLIWCM